VIALPEDVAQTCAAYLELADRHAPGLVEGLYLQGSVTLGDYRPGLSDIDFVAVTGRVPDPDIVRVVHSALRRRHGKPFFDGLYVGWDDLRRDPAQVAAGPAVHEWRVYPASRFERHLVTWHVLAQDGVAVRGPAVAELAVHTDWPALTQTTRRNLIEYWTPWTQRSARGIVGLTSWATTWGVLGMPGYGTP
jgi:predicted nucleotidyltransferase